MNPFVFISHSSQDAEFVKELQERLNASDVSTWLASERIPPGADWGESIRGAIEACAALVVVVSQASVNSKWVREEVLSAQHAQKTVIQLVMEPVTPPFGWNRLQAIHWSKEGERMALDRLIAALPKNTADAFKQYLGDRKHFADLRQLICRHLEWLPIEYFMFPSYGFVFDRPMSSGGSVDIFAARLDSGGPKAFLYYMGSPYEHPFMKSGRPARSMAGLLDMVSRHFAELRGSLSVDHHLHPARVLTQQRDLDIVCDYKINSYKCLHIHVIAGQRHHYEQRDFRGKMLRAWKEEHYARFGKSGDDIDNSIEVMSYTRLLQHIRPQ